MPLRSKHIKFNESKRRHALVITNHGCHAPIINITTDTAGQNIYVNNFTKALLRLDYKITILNRGGFEHPATGELHKGIVYYDDIWGDKGIYCRIIYLEDDIDEFTCKEELEEGNLFKEKEFFFRIAEKIEFGLKKIDLINSHYWDGGILGIIIQEELKKRYNITIPHIWTPHSLGILKRKNYEGAPKNEIKLFKFPDRIKYEERVLSNVDGVVYTSNKIAETLSEYSASVKNLFRFPPGIDNNVFKPRKVEECKKGLNVIKKRLGLDIKDVIELIKKNVVFLEASRTDTTKQKDLILKSFSMIKNKKNALMIINVNNKSPLYNSILEIYKELKNKNIVLIDEIIPDEEMSQLFSLADVYITASLMEGWGIAIQEAAASNCAIISSEFVPFVKEVLKDKAFIVVGNEPIFYAEKMDIMIENDNLRKKLAKEIYEIVKDQYSWSGLAQNLITELKNCSLI